MEIVKNENEIIIKINKENYLYNRLINMGNIQKFIEYVFDLQRTLNGIDSGEFPCFESIEDYKIRVKDFDKKKLKKKRIYVLTQLVIACEIYQKLLWENIVLYQ